MGIYFANQEYNEIHVGGQEYDRLQASGAGFHSTGPAAGVARQVGSATRFGLNSPNPGGLAGHGGILYMAAWANDGRNAGLFTLNAATGVATRVGTANNFGVNPAEDVPGGLKSHGGVLYMVGDRTNALYSLNTTTGVATRIGSATNFGNSESSPSGLLSRNNVLYLIGRSQGISTLNTSTGVATRVAGISGASRVHGVALHKRIVYAIADGERALFTLNIATGAATRVGRAPAGFGVGENDPRGLESFGGKLLMVGNTLDALLEVGV